MSLGRVEVLFGFSTGIVVDDRDVVQGNTVFSNERIIVGSVHEVVKAGDPLRGDLGKRDCSLAVVH